MQSLVVSSAVLVVLLAAGAALYFRVGWDRMESACSEGPTASASLSWSVPDGFTCRFHDGTERTSLLWM